MSVKVDLKTPIKLGEKTIASITLKPPTYRLLMAFGEPVTLATKDGISLFTENVETIRLYQEECVDCDPNALGLLEFDDAIALKDAMVGFFQKARATSRPSTSSDDTRASSPSGSASTFEASTI